MKFKNKLIPGTIRKRYKRFLSDIELSSGEVITAHVPNTGSMKTCWEPGWKVYLSQSDDPKRKLKYTLEMTNNGQTNICVNTAMTNKLVREALEQKNITELEAYNEIRPEKKVHDSRLDFYLTQEGLVDAYVEVKNVTLLGKNQTALFPDSVSTRGQKHLKDLIKLKEEGHRSVMLYIVNREDVTKFAPAKDIDPEYAKLLKEAYRKGVEVLAYQCDLSADKIEITHKIEVIL